MGVVGRHVVAVLPEVDQARRPVVQVVEPEVGRAGVRHRHDSGGPVDRHRERVTEADSGHCSAPFSPTVSSCSRTGGAQKSLDANPATARVARGVEDHLVDPRDVRRRPARLRRRTCGPNEFVRHVGRERAVRRPGCRRPCREPRTRPPGCSGRRRRSRTWSTVGVRRCPGLELAVDDAVELERLALARTRRTCPPARSSSRRARCRSSCTTSAPAAVCGEHVARLLGRRVERLDRAVQVEPAGELLGGEVAGLAPGADGEAGLVERAVARPGATPSRVTVLTGLASPTTVSPCVARTRSPCVIVGQDAELVRPSSTLDPGGPAEWQ